MGKFDRKKFRENLKQEQQKSQEDLELEDKSPSEVFLIKVIRFLKANRLRFFSGLLVILVIIGAFFGFGEFNQYRENQAILEAEKLEKKLEKTPEDTAKLLEMEGFLQKHKGKLAELRIAKQAMDLHVKLGQFQKAAEYAFTIANSIQSPPELKAYFFYLHGSISEEAGDKTKALESYSRVLEQISSKKEMSIMNTWALFHSGRLKYELGDKEGAISELKKVLDMENEQLDFALRQPKLMATYLILKINKG